MFDRVPRTFFDGRLRLSTVLLSLLFVSFLTLYLLVRPVPESVRERAERQAEPIETTPPMTPTEPMTTTRQTPATTSTTEEEPARTTTRTTSTATQTTPEAPGVGETSSPPPEEGPPTAEPEGGPGAGDRTSTGP
jgi:hypothetical protein